MENGLNGWPKPPLFITTQLVSTTTQSIATGATFVDVVLGSILESMGKFATPDHNGIYIPMDGLYSLIADAGYDNNATGQRDLQFLVTKPGGTSTPVRGTFPGDATFDTYMPLNTQYVLRTGWKVSLQTRQDSGGSINLQTSSYLSASLVHGL